MPELQGNLVVVGDDGVAGKHRSGASLSTNTRKGQPRVVTAHSHDHDEAVLLPERLRRDLDRRPPATIGTASAIACGVLVPVVSLEGDWGVVYTLRAEHLPNHKGQVAFPGGKRSVTKDRDLLQTALREAHEEIGIAAADVDVVGRLDDVCTMAGGFVITPYVGVLPAGYAYRANPAEVAAVFTVRLRDLAEPGNHATETREWQGSRYPIDVITAGPHKIWGATQRITMDLIERLGLLRAST
jgi:8-oxo-dGTP pyrophosphatase MutT (NUDIX family)